MRQPPVKDRCYSADPKNAKMLLFVSARKATYKATLAGVRTDFRTIDDARKGSR